MCIFYIFKTKFWPINCMLGHNYKSSKTAAEVTSRIRELEMMCSCTQKSIQITQTWTDTECLIISALLREVILSSEQRVYWLITCLAPHSAHPPSRFPRVPVVISHALSVFYELSLCRAPMVTCGPSKQDKLGAHFPWLTMHDNETHTRGSHHQPIQMSATLFEVVEHYVNPQCFSPAQALTDTQKQELHQRWSCDVGWLFLL